MFSSLARHPNASASPKVSGGLLFWFRGAAYEIPGIPLKKEYGEDENLLMTGMLKKPYFRYIAPFAVFMILSEVQRFYHGAALFGIYGLKAGITALLLFFLFRGHTEEITGKWDWKAAALGVLVFAVWIAPGLWKMPAPGAFDPRPLGDGLPFWSAVAVRTAGASLVVPVMEELFWRSFLMRYLVRPDFLGVRPGTYTRFSFWAVVFIFMLAHKPWEWPQTVFAGAAYGGYLVKTGNLKGCILAHAVTNFCLAVYVTAAGAWGYW